MRGAKWDCLHRGLMCHRWEGGKEDVFLVGVRTKKGSFQTSVILSGGEQDALFRREC